MSEGMKSYPRSRGGLNLHKVVELESCKGRNVDVQISCTNTHTHKIGSSYEHIPEIIKRSG